ncbi:hypothetical protein Vretifemale_15069 [Volvox reticuliferus]|uniref:Trehalase n=1 Tax=Volvox reticuliferus TaxID=1737510 RepID=A0A8J4CU86_9CHLO|nr:hypothetical protein Vretifemale_15069 [Volvox reticuliferus]
MRDLGTAVHGLWKTLCRQVSPTVINDTDRHTILPLPHPFIVPGDRFRECYSLGPDACSNWDSYWIIRGLLACDLVPAAECLVRNLLHLVDVWGFVPNGARQYYTNRSQPPLLSAMVLALWNVSNDDSLLDDALPLLVKQHRYWNAGNKAVRVRAGGQSKQEDDDGDGRDDRAGRSVKASHEGASEVFTLSRYHSDHYAPRPESFREDVQLAAMAGVSGREAALLFCDVASAAESGWDFSSRWFVGGDGLQYTRTTQIVPADLNAWLYRMERDIAAIAAQLGATQLQNEFMARASARLRGINAVMWSAADNCWHDLLLRESRGTMSSAPAQDTAFLFGNSVSSAESAVYDVELRSGVFASNWVPLWCGCAEPGSALAEAAVMGLQASGLVQPGGLLTSLYHSGEQWDAPNAWPPLVHMIIEAAVESGVTNGTALANQLADNWLHANMVAWQATGHMHEKYNGYVPGGIGRGGEYKPQVGFGWSNGVLMALLERKWKRAARET